MRYSVDEFLQADPSLHPTQMNNIKDERGMLENNEVSFKLSLFCHQLIVNKRERCCYLILILFVIVHVNVLSDGNTAFRQKSSSRAIVVSKLHYFPSFLVSWRPRHLSYVAFYTLKIQSDINVKIYVVQCEYFKTGNSFYE